jgi:hypothetical protein
MKKINVAVEFYEDEVLSFGSWAFVLEGSGRLLDKGSAAVMGTSWCGLWLRGAIAALESPAIKAGEAEVVTSDHVAMEFLRAVANGDVNTSSTDILPDENPLVEKFAGLARGRVADWSGPYDTPMAIAIELAEKAADAFDDEEEPSACDAATAQVG